MKRKEGKEGKEVKEGKEGKEKASKRKKDKESSRRGVGREANRRRDTVKLMACTLLLLERNGTHSYGIRQTFFPFVFHSENVERPHQDEIIIGSFSEVSHSNALPFFFWRDRRAREGNETRV